MFMTRTIVQAINLVRLKWDGHISGKLDYHKGNTALVSEIFALQRATNDHY
jgi:hypothetical protein